MYFNFEDNHPDTPTLPRTLTRLEVVLLTAVFYLSVVILAMVLPQTEWFKAMEARREAALEEQQRQEMERQRENARFVFVQPRLDMPSQAPPKRYELSDIDRQARTVERAARPTNSMPFSRGNTFERIESVQPMPETRQAITRIGLVPVDTGPPEELQAFVRSEIARWAEVVRQSGAKVE